MPKVRQEIADFDAHARALQRSCAKATKGSGKKPITSVIPASAAMGISNGRRVGASIPKANAAAVGILLIFAGERLFLRARAQEAD